MVITVNTSGPLNSIASIPSPDLGTMERLVQLVADEIDDTQNEYLVQIQEAIFSAIRFCEREPFYFNKSREVTFSTVVGKEFYGKEDNVNISTLSGLQAVFLIRGSGDAEKLRRIPTEDIEILSSRGSSGGVPTAYCYYSQQLRLYPIPQTKYTIRLQISPIKLEVIKDANQLSPWFLEGFDLIKARVKYEIYKNILKDSDGAMTALNDFNEIFRALKIETSRRESNGKIFPTFF